MAQKFEASQRKYQTLRPTNLDFCEIVDVIFFLLCQKKKNDKTLKKFLFFFISTLYQYFFLVAIVAKQCNKVRSRNKE